MAFFLFYPASAFKKGLPDERSGVADSGRTTTLRLEPDAKPVVIELRDDDKTLNELDDTQALARSVEFDGQTYPAGTPFSAAYDLVDGGSGLKVTALHLGGDGWQQGPVQGVLTTAKLEVGEKYRFDINRTSYRQGNAYDEYIACFVEGTRIETVQGLRRVEDLAVGDLLPTKDAGPQPIRWIGSRLVVAQGRFAPIEFARGVLGNDRALRLSPQHRVLCHDPALQLLFGLDAALVAAKHLVNGDTVRAVAGAQVRYWHLLLEGHQIIRAEGAEVETMLPGPVSAKGFGAAAETELQTLFPDVFGAGLPRVQPARPYLTAQEAKLLPPLQRARRARMLHWRAAA